MKIFNMKTVLLFVFCVAGQEAVRAESVNEFAARIFATGVRPTPDEVNSAWNCFGDEEDSAPAKGISPVNCYDTKGALNMLSFQGGNYNIRSNGKRGRVSFNEKSVKVDFLAEKEEQPSRGYFEFTAVHSDGKTTLIKKGFDVDSKKTRYLVCMKPEDLISRLKPAEQKINAEKAVEATR